mgnify:FL=1
MLGGNAEYLAKADLKKAGLSDEMIAEATGFLHSSSAAPTTASAGVSSSTILAARGMVTFTPSTVRKEVTTWREEKV